MKTYLNLLTGQIVTTDIKPKGSVEISPAEKLIFELLFEVKQRLSSLEGFLLPNMPVNNQLENEVTNTLVTPAEKIDD